MSVLAIILILILCIVLGFSIKDLIKTIISLKNKKNQNIDKEVK